MAGGNEVKVSYIADIRDLTERLKSVTGLTASESRQQVAAISTAVNAMKKAENAAGQVASANTTAAAATSKFAKAFGPLGGIISRVAGPQIGGLSASVAALTSATEGFGVPAGIAGAAVLALGAAAGLAAAGWALYTDDSRRASAEAALVAAAMADLKPLIDDTRLAEIDAAVAIGTMTEEAGRLERDGIASMKKFASATAGAAKQISDLQAGRGTWARFGADLAESVGQSSALSVVGVAQLGQVIASMTTSTAEADKTIQDLNETEQKGTESLKKGRIFRSQAAAAVRSHTAASQAATAASQAATAAAKQEAEAVKAATAAFAARLQNAEGEQDWAAATVAARALADAAVAKSGAFRLTEIERIQQAESDAVTAYIADAERGQMSTEKIAAGELAIHANYAAQITAIEKAETAKRIEGALSVADASIGALTSVYDAGKKNIDTSTKAGKRAAMAQWRTEKGVHMAAAGILMALGIARAAASLPPPANAIPIATAAITGAANVAAVAAAPAPKFHAGGLVQAPDEVHAVLQTGEAVLSRTGRAALGDEAIQRANSGRDAAPPIRVIAETHYRHQSFDRFITDNLLRGGPLAQAIGDTGEIPGHRSRADR